MAHQRDAKMLFFILSQLSKGKPMSEKFLQARVELHKSDLAHEKIDQQMKSLIALPDKILIGKSKQFTEGFYLDGDFNDHVSTLIDLLDFEEHLGLTNNTKEKTEEQQRGLMDDYEYIRSIQAQFNQLSLEKDIKFEEQLKEFVVYVKQFHRKLEQKDCVDLYLKPIITRFKKVYFQSTLPEKRLRKEFINPLTLQQKNNLLLKIAEQYSNHWSSICNNREVKVIYRDERFTEFFNLMNRFDRFSNLQLEIRDTEEILKKRIVQQMTVGELLSQPKKFIDLGKSIH